MKNTIKKKFFLNNDIYIYIYISVLLTGLIFSCHVEDFNDPKPTPRSSFMDMVPDTLETYFENEDINIDKVVHEFFEAAQKTPGIRNLLNDEEIICKKQFRNILSSVYDFATPRPEQIVIPISARDMRKLTGYDWAKEKTITLNMHYNGLPVYIPDDNFRAYLQYKIPAAFHYGTDVMDAYSLYVINLDDINVQKKRIKSLQGIQYFTNLKDLNCVNNELKELDLSKNKILETLNCSFNLITKLDLRKNGNLNTLKCANNKLEELNMEKNEKLITLNCNNNLIREINLSKNTKLNFLIANNNKLEKLDLRGNPRLRCLQCNDNEKIKSLDISHNLFLDLCRDTDNNVKIIDIDEEAFKDLSARNFVSIDRKRVPSAVTKDEIGRIIRNILGLSFLEDDDIELEADAEGTLKITISNHADTESKPRIITLTGFRKEEHKLGRLDISHSNDKSKFYECFEHYQVFQNVKMCV